MISDSLYFKLTYLVPNAFPSVIIIFSVHFNEYMINQIHDFVTIKY